MKTLRAKNVVEAAEKLWEIQNKKRRLNEQLRKLSEDEDFYSALLERRASEDFKYAGDKYMKVVEFRSHKRKILDQRKAVELLGDKAPYKTITVKCVKVDYLYE